MSKQELEQATTEGTNTRYTPAHQCKSISVVCALRGSLPRPRWVPCCHVYGWCLGGTGCGVMCVWCPGFKLVGSKCIPNHRISL